MLLHTVEYAAYITLSIVIIAYSSIHIVAYAMTCDTRRVCHYLYGH